MHTITNQVHYITKIKQAFPIFLVYVEKHGGGLGMRLAGLEVNQYCSQQHTKYTQSYVCNLEWVPLVLG